MISENEALPYPATGGPGIAHPDFLSSQRIPESSKNVYISILNKLTMLIKTLDSVSLFQDTERTEVLKNLF